MVLRAMGQGGNLFQKKPLLDGFGQMGATTGLHALSFVILQGISGEGHNGVAGLCRSCSQARMVRVAV